MSYYGLASMAVALLLSFYAAGRTINRRLLHGVSLSLGGIGFLAMFFIPSPTWLLLCFCLIGIAWASILSMPYALIAGSIDEKHMGVYMGIFNMFIVIPQILASLVLGKLVTQVFDGHAIYAMVLAGISLILGAVSLIRVTEPRNVSAPLAAAH